MSIDLEIRKTHFHLNGVNYFRGNAESVQFGDAGDKKTPLTQENYLEVLENIPRNKLKIHQATQIDLRGASVSGSDFGVSITVPGVGSLGASTVARQLEDQTLSLVKLDMLPKEIIDAANSSPDVLTELRRAGGGARLVHQAFIILQMTTATSLSRSTRLDITGTVKSWTISGTAGTSSGSTTKVTVSPGTTFAYLLLKPKWNKSGKQIDDFDDDQWSLY